MHSLLFKEIKSFFNSLIGYLAIIIVLVIIGAMMWIFPGSMNVMDNGYANIDVLFAFAPWIFMFLIPAITMRSFADENKSGTIEILLTKPLYDLQIIMAKFLAGLVIVAFSLLPTFIYFYTVYQLANPVGNIDMGGTWGSYIGLLLLGASFVAIGIFASSITSNQIIAFITGMFLCFIFYLGFEFMSSLRLFGKIDNVILALGINYHYNSLSRGVIDTRDVIYFISLAGLFILLTKTAMESRKW